MQQEPQTPPVPQEPQSSPTPMQPQGQQGGSFYQPVAPAPYIAQPVGQPEVLPSPYAAPAHNVNAVPSTLTWEASEYVHNDKGSTWLIGLITITLIFAGIALYLQAWTFLILVVVMGVTMGIFAFRPPHVIRYTLNDNGVQIASKVFHYNDFRAFGIMQEGAFYTMTLIPVKRFSPSLSVYFSEAQGEHIVDIVGSHLPMEHIEPDAIDHIMHRLRF